MSSLLARTARALCLAVLLLGSPSASAQFVLDAVPGGLVEIPLASRDQPRPEAWFGQRRILVTTFARRWVGLIGLPFSLVPGNYVIQVRLEDGADVETRPFTVYPGRETGRSLVARVGAPDPPPQLALAWRETQDAELPLQAPVPAPARPTFGRYHPTQDTGSGEPDYADFVAFSIAADATAGSPGAGRIAATSTQEAGTWLWIDHGMGLYTRLGPLSSTSVQPAEAVAAGEPVGRIRLDDNDTPRALYLSVFLNGAAINPFLIADLDRSGADDGAGAAAR